MAAAAVNAPAQSAAQGLTDDATAPGATAASDSGTSSAGEEHSSLLPIWGEEARKRGYALPEPFGIGLVYYGLDRDIRVTDVRIGRNGDTPRSVTQYADFGTTSSVRNVNLKLDAWLFPFLNVYAIGGWVENDSSTKIAVELPPLLPNQPPRQRSLLVPTHLEGTVKGYGMTLAGGYKQFFAALDANRVSSELGFDERVSGSIASLRVGWNGDLFSRPLRSWVSVTKWNLFTTIKSSNIADPDGGTLAIEIDQGPKHAYTYGIGASYTPFAHFDIAADVGGDMHGGWYVALVPVWRF